MVVVAMAAWPLVSTNVLCGVGSCPPRAGARPGGSDGDPGPAVSLAPAARPTAARPQKKTTAPALTSAARTVPGPGSHLLP